MGAVETALARSTRAGASPGWHASGVVIRGDADPVVGGPAGGAWPGVTSRTPALLPWQTADGSGTRRRSVVLAQVDPDLQLVVDGAETAWQVGSIALLGLIIAGLDTRSRAERDAAAPVETPPAA
jgi:hypothetical protein